MDNKLYIYDNNIPLDFVLYLTTVTTMMSMGLFKRLVLFINFYTIEICGFNKYLHYVPGPLHYLWLCADFATIRSLDD